MAVENKNVLSDKTREMNTAFAEKVTASAMEVIRRQVVREKARGDLNTEVYYSIHNPFAEGTDEHAYVEEMLGGGSGKDPAYIDLFDRLRIMLKEALDCEGVHSFLMLNCRFDRQFEDNFLLYALVSWGG